MATPPPSPSPPARPRARRVLLIGLGVVVGALAVCEAIEWPFLRGPVTRALAKGLHRDVSIGEDFGVRLLGSVRIRGASLVIGPAPEGPVLRDASGRVQDFLRAEQVRLVLPYATVFALARGQRDKPLVVTALDVGRLDAALVRDDDGAANWHFGPERRPAAPPALPRFERLVVQNGSLHLDDAPSQIKIDLAVQTHEGSGDAGAARLVATATGRYRKSPLQGRLESTGLLPLVAPERGATPVPATLSLKVGATEGRFEGKVGDVLHLASLDGSFHLAAPSLAAVGDSLGLTLPTTSPFLMDGRVGREGQVWSADIAGLTLGTSRLRGQFRYDMAPDKPRLTGQLGGARLALPDLAPAFGAPPSPHARAAQREASERRLPQREFDIPSLGAMDADVAIKLDSFYLGTPQLESLAPLEARLVLKDGRLAVQDLLARSAGGEVRGAFALDAREAKAPRWDADLRWSGIQLERFVKARDTLRKDAKAKQAAGEAAPGYVSGALSGQAKLAGRGRSVAQLLGSLDGSTQMWVRDGKISHLVIEMSGIDLAESLGIVLRGDEPLPMRCAVARLVVKDGALTPEVAVVDTADTTLVATGAVSLADEKLDLVINARPRDMTPVALRGPLHIDGSFAHPKVHLDKKAIGLRVAAAAALASVAAPLASLLAFFDVGDGDTAVCSDALQQLRGAAPRAALKASQRAAERDAAAENG